jgi:hypothetical protein
MVNEEVQMLGHLADVLDKNNQALEAKTWSPESNKYSRCYTTLFDTVIDQLSSPAIKLFLYCIRNMSSINQLTITTVHKIPNMSKTVRYKAIAELKLLYAIYQYDDNTVMINPKIVALTKHRKSILTLLDEWNKTSKI